MAASQRRIFHWKGEEQVSHVRYPERAIGSNSRNIPCGWKPISHIPCVIGASILFAPPRCTDVLSQRVCLLWTVEAGQKAAQSELRPGTITVSASQKHLAPVLEGE